jgi:crotonobetainyl-CoA:carnitine CoA-transferase CaiB-like acyl-CoA transferase
LDLGTDIPGPYCAKLLADYGAEVIKIEPPSGDPLRRSGPFPDDLPDPEKSGMFLYLNANKRGVTLEHTAALGREIFAGLVEWADVLIENNLPSQARAKGLDWATLSKVNPRLVLTSITPFGQTGPCRDYSAEEISLFAMSGRMYSHGRPDREPLRYAPDIAWFQIGQTAAVATMAALFLSKRLDFGQQVDISGLEALIANVDTWILSYTMGGVMPQRTETTLSSLNGLVPCKDGYLLTITNGERFFRRLLQATGLGQLLDDERFSTPAGRLQHFGELDALLLPWFAERTRQEAFTELEKYSVMCSPVNTVEEVLEDPQIRAREFFFDIDHPSIGRLTFPGAPFEMTETPWSIRRPAPRLGEHNHEIYYGLLGRRETEIRALAGSGII